MLARTDSDLWALVPHATGDHELVRIDPDTNTIVATTTVLGLNQGSMAADDSGVWALFVRSSLLVRIDPLTLETRSLEIAAPAGVTLSGGSVWVTTAAGAPNTVIRITPTP